MDRLFELRGRGVADQISLTVVAEASAAFAPARAFQGLVGQLRGAITGASGAMVHVTSATAGAGVSTVARGLAIAAAAMPWCRPLLLDRNPGPRDQSAALAVPLPDLAGGLALNGQAELAAIGIEGPSGHRACFHAARLAPDAVADLAPGRAGTVFADLHDALRAAYNLIIIDCTDIGGERLFLPFVATAPDIIMVVRAEGTKRRDVSGAQAEIARLGGNLRGIVVTGQRRHVPALIGRFL